MDKLASAETASNFYPRPPRGGRRGSCYSLPHSTGISIHALREEGDKVVNCFVGVDGQFLSTPSARRATSLALISPLPETISIHALREEGDPWRLISVRRSSKFLSTPSARRATGASCSTSKGKTNFYPRPPRGGRPSSGALPGPALKISIHALREEGDALPSGRPPGPGKFLSTPSARRATRFLCQVVVCKAISIHALREEGDIAQ